MADEQSREVAHRQVQDRRAPGKRETEAGTTSFPGDCSLGALTRGGADRRPLAPFGRHQFRRLTHGGVPRVGVVAQGRGAVLVPVVLLHDVDRDAALEHVCHRRESIPAVCSLYPSELILFSFRLSA